MKKLILSILFLLPLISHAECVHEYMAFGHELQNKSAENIFIQNEDGSFSKPRDFKSMQVYTVQETIPHIQDNYDNKYVKYYRYARIQEFLSLHSERLKNLGYEISIIGQSLKGRNLYKVFPTSINKNKKLILMFGRHHGDEGTANWIIEGFLEKFLNSPEFHEKFQLVLYPMVNPDGAEKRVRYNSNNRDLNREWDSASRNTKDEIQSISKDLFNSYLSKGIKPIVALDMHGSFTEDFIFRVSKNFLSSNFYQSQQEFIDELASRDQFQAGNFQTSNGHRRMARIVLVRDHQINALTHETPRDIPLKSNRSVQTLKEQGFHLVESIQDLY